MVCDPKNRYSEEETTLCFDTEEKTINMENEFEEKDDEGLMLLRRETQ